MKYNYEIKKLLKLRTESLESSDQPEIEEIKNNEFLLPWLEEVPNISKDELLDKKELFSNYLTKIANMNPYLLANSEQTAVLLGLKQFISIITKNKDYPHKLLSLRGSAGVGKSWTVNQLIGIIQDMGLEINISAPTHEALNVIRAMKEETGNPISINTIQSFLNLKLDYDAAIDDAIDGETVRKPKLIFNEYNQCLISTDVLVIDESSMVSDNLYEYILKTLNEGRAKVVIFVGDECQLLPVEAGDNFIFQKPEILQFNLTKIVRQKESSSIIQLATTLKNYILTKTYPKTLSHLFEETEEIRIFRDTSFLDTYFNDENTKIVGSFKNVTVDEYNAYIRYMTTNEVKPYIIGDKLIFQEPVVNSRGEVQFQNGESVIIESLNEVAPYSEKSIYGIGYYDCKDDEGNKFRLLHENSKDDFNKEIKKMIDDANKATGFDRKKLWKAYFTFKGKFAKVKYAYCSTIHKLQGKTVHSMYFDARDLVQIYNWNPNMALRLFYVAVSRASDKLYVLR